MPPAFATPAPGYTPLTFADTDYLGGSLDYSGPHTFDINGDLAHPFVKDVDGLPVIITGTPGATLYVLELPFGSITQDQPVINFDVELSINDQVAPGAPITLDVGSGFRYGTDPLDNPMPPPGGQPEDGDPSLLQQVLDTAQVTPLLIGVDKRLIAPEGDTAIGSNFEYTFEIEVEIAPSQTISQLIITDNLPTSLVYINDSLNLTFSGITGTPTHSAVFDHGDSNCTITATNEDNVGPCSDTDLVVSFPTDAVVAGSDGGSVTVSFDFYLNVTDASGEQTGTAPGPQGVNHADAAGSWGGNLGRPGPQTVNDSDSYPLIVTNSQSPEPSHPALGNGTLRLQKWVDDGTPDPFARTETITSLPGDTVRFALEFQISDASAFRNVVITDPLPDGLLYVADSVEFSYTRRGASYTPSVNNPSNWVDETNRTFNNNHEEVLTFDVQQILGDHEDDGDMLGACVEPGGGPLTCDAHGGTTGWITFEAQVLDTYRADENLHVVQNDSLANTATMAGEVLWVENLNLADIRDSSLGTATVEIPQATASKAVAFVNDTAVTGGARPSVAPGDTVTFRLRVNLGVLSFHELTLTDYLPLPVFVATAPTVVGACDGGNQHPGANQACFVTTGLLDEEGGPVETWVPAASHPIAPSASSTANSVTFDFGSFTRDGNVTPASFELLYTVEVEDTVLTDGLFITNLLEVQDYNIDKTFEAVSNQLAQLRYTRPQLNISNGVIRNRDSSHITDPEVVPGVITSTNRGAAEFNYDFENLDAGDRVTYLVIVENTGMGVNGCRRRLQRH